MLKNNFDEKNRKSIFAIIIIILICFISFICIRLFFKDQIKDMIKHSTSSKVIENEDELLEIIAELDNEVIPEIIYYKNTEDIDNLSIVAYKDLDNQKISEVFADFKLVCMKNELEEKGYVCFSIYPYADWLLGETNGVYLYGFYYSSDDKPRDSSGENYDNSEYEEDNWLIDEWYRTEKIADNWWYYEEILTLKESATHR